MIPGFVKARRWAVLAVPALVLAGCGERAADPRTGDIAGEPASAPKRSLTPEEEALVAPLSPVPASDGWEFSQSAGGARLIYHPDGDGATRTGDPTLVITCPGAARMIVRLPRIAPIGSEERMSIGSGDTVVALVADPDEGTAGIAGRGPVPEALPTMLEQGFAATYGASSTGVLPPVPASIIDRMRSACN